MRKASGGKGTAFHLSDEFEWIALKGVAALHRYELPIAVTRRPQIVGVGPGGFFVERPTGITLLDDEDEIKSVFGVTQVREAMTHSATTLVSLVGRRELIAEACRVRGEAVESTDDVDSLLYELQQFSEDERQSDGQVFWELAARAIAALKPRGQVAPVLRLERPHVIYLSRGELRLIGNGSDGALTEEQACERLRRRNVKEVEASVAVAIRAHLRERALVLEGTIGRKQGSLAMQTRLAEILQTDETLEPFVDAEPVDPDLLYVSMIERCVPLSPEVAERC